MGKRKLHGAALAAYNRKRGIGSRSTSTALARRSSTALAARPKTRTITRVVKVRARRRGGTGISRMGGGFVQSLKSQTWDLGAAVGYGYLTRSDTTKAIELRAMTLDHLPTSEKLGKPLSHGLLMTFIASQLGGTPRRIVGHLAHAALMQAASNLGAAAGDTDQFAQMSGDDDPGDDEFAGAIDASAEESDGSDPADDNTLQGDDDDDDGA